MQTNVKNLPFIISIVAILFSSCMTAEKAKGYLANHREAAAEFCDAQFPAEKTTKIKVKEDTAKSNQAKRELNTYKDSILNKAVQRNDSIQMMRDRIYHLQQSGAYSQATADVLQAQLNGIKPVDTSSLRRSIEAKIYSSIKPCKDSIITTDTGISTAKYMATYLKSERVQGEKDEAIGSRDKWRKWCIITWSLIGIYIAIRFFACKLGLIGKFIK